MTSIFGCPTASSDVRTVLAAKALWVTYRRRISSHLVPSLRSDAGWGCTLRSMQMLFAAAYLRAGGSREGAASLIIDSDDACAAFSLNRLVAASGKTGTWFGPHEAASWMLRGGSSSCAAPADASSCAQPALGILLCCDAMVSRAEIAAVARSTSMQAAAAALAARSKVPDISAPWQPTLALLPLRLGLASAVDSRYVPLLCALMRLPSFAGAVGGTPRHSLFFVGEDRGTFLFLDPHTTQDAERPAVAGAWCTAPLLEGALAVGGSVASRLSLSATSSRSCTPSAAFLASCTVPAPGRMAAVDIDSTICLAFYFGDAEELDAFDADVHALASQLPLALSFLEVVDRRPSVLDDDALKDLDMPSPSSSSFSSHSSESDDGGGGDEVTLTRRALSTDVTRGSDTAPAPISSAAARPHGRSFFGFSLRALFSVFVGAGAQQAPTRKARRGRRRVHSAPETTTPPIPAEAGCGGGAAAKIAAADADVANASAALTSEEASAIALPLPQPPPANEPAPEVSSARSRLESFEVISPRVPPAPSPMS